MDFPPSKYLDELGDLLGELEAFAKTREVVSALGERKLNASFFLLAAQAMRLYAAGDTDGAANDFADIADEIRARKSAKPKDIVS